jgi:N-methylhydantoinase A
MSGGIMLGIDVGGTFTDLMAFDPATGRLWAAKVPTTPDNQAAGVLAAVAAAGVALPDVQRIVHGTTVATNAVLEGKGARVAVLTTRGFRDVLEIKRGNRPKLYDLKYIPSPPLVARPFRLEVDERTLADGTVERAVTPAAIASALGALDGGRTEVEAWAICFLHAYRNDANERAAAEYLWELAAPSSISCSSAVVPEFREYERFSTTVLNAMVSPALDRYLGELEARLAEGGFRYPLLIMQSSGGTSTARATRRLPAVTMLSGPAGGVNGAIFLARSGGVPNVITCDMGGTSTDVCLIKGYRARTTHQGTIAGHPTRLPQIEINTVGAGGGSIAGVDLGRMLKVGPASAGARPGPAAYGLGGTAATVTDANVALGRLGGEGRLAGSLALRSDLARSAVGAVAEGMGGLGLEETAEGIVRLAVVRMAGAIREISVRRGEDPRDYVLMAYGGAGPLVASELARDLGIAEVLVPPYPGNLSALGLLASPPRQDLVRTDIRALDAVDDAGLAGRFADLIAEGRGLLVEEGADPAEIAVEGGCDLRYVGQAYTLSVPLDPRRPERAALLAAFHEQHQAVYGHGEPSHPVEIVNYRLSALGPRVEPPLAPAGDRPRPAGGGPASAGRRPVWFGGRVWESAVYRREDLSPADAIVGPAIVDEMGSTTCLWPNDRATVDPRGNLRLTVGRA